jgi:hypothetical protein
MLPLGVHIAGRKRVILPPGREKSPPQGPDSRNIAPFPSSTPGWKATLPSSFLNPEVDHVRR